MQGIAGSGKSTYAEMMASQWASNIDVGYDVVIRSTDEFWYSTDHPDDPYNFDIARIEEAHRWNQQRVIHDMQQETAVIIVDNTNIKRWHVEPYIQMAQVFDYDIQVVRVDVPLEVAIKRQENRPEDRRVPEEMIRRMYEDMERLL
jgi:predicted kinase